MSQNHSPCLDSGNANKAAWWWIVVFFYGLSGFTSLAYEVLWSRMLSMQFGVSIFGVVLTVTAFMAGLGLGSLAGARWVRCCTKPLILFAMLEMAIALYAVFLPGFLHRLSGWLDGFASHYSLTQWYFLQGAEALVLLLIPAFAMGVGFALVLKVIERTPLSLGKLYGLNTIGGVLGALFPLWSLPVLGWVDSVYVVAVLGFVVGIAALLTSKFSPGSEVDVFQGAGLSRPSIAMLLLYAGIGPAASCWKLAGYACTA